MRKETGKINILYISQTDINLDGNGGIYSDLINSLMDYNADITLLCFDNKYEKTCYEQKTSYNKLMVRVGNQFVGNIVKKALVLLSLKSKAKKAIKRYIKGTHFDLVLYATPPITFCSVIKYCKKKYKCNSYLMLKDIFPQNAVDLGMMKKRGLLGIVYKYFRRKEKALYKYSDKIGCMSPANIDYLLKHNDIDRSKVELFPNSVIIKPYEQVVGRDTLGSLGIDEDKLVFIYGGNLGKPQGLGFLADGIRACEEIEDVHFIIIGKGTEQKAICKALEKSKNATVLEYMAKSDYLKLCKECDVGLVCLDKRFTIPNYPSRILSYMENAKPVFACTDKVSDIKELVEGAEFGKWVFSENPQEFKKGVLWFLENKSNLSKIGMNGRVYFENNFDVKKHIDKITKVIKTN